MNRVTKILEKMNANWGNNNVPTHGAGAIGFRKPHTESLESLIRQYAAECKKLQELR